MAKFVVEGKLEGKEWEELFPVFKKREPAEKMKEAWESCAKATTEFRIKEIK